VGIEDSWAVIHDWLGLHHPSMLTLLHGPAKAADIKRLEKQIGQALPDNFQASYRIHDGSDRNSGVFVGLSLMSLSEVGRTWEGWAEIADDEEIVEDLSEDCQSQPPGAVKPLYANRGWVPFAGDSQNYVAIDLDPGPKGKVGQIINAGRDDEVRHVIADTFEGFLDFVAGLFQAEKVGLPPGEKADNPRWLGVKGKKQDLLTGLPELLAGAKRRKSKPKQ
jgi:cell wall assembly regulator SMI1